MTNPTTNFGWVMPTATDLVTDLPADFNVFGQGVDTSMADLLGGTTGQVLSKTSATSMDFTWTTPNPGDITAVNVTSPITGGGTSGDVTIAIQDALTTQKGAVQLSDSTSTTSSVLAATPTAVKAAYDLANAAIPKTLTTTTGDTIYASAANTPARLAVGSTGQVLTVAGGVPTWATPSSGSMTQLATGTISGATTTLSSISGSYKDLRILVRNFKPTTDGSGLQLRINSDSTASRHSTNDSFGQSQAVAFNGTSITLTSDNDNSVATGLVITNIYDYANATTWKMLDNVEIGVNPTTTTQYDARNNTGYYNQIAAITSLQFIVSGGATSGTYYLYGVN